MSHPFEVGKRYRNRVGEYVVQAIEGDHMTIRYVDGGTLETSVSIQARIWENIQFEEQMVREEERQRLAREARRAARKRTAQAKAAKAKPVFGGFQPSDFEPRKRGISWSSRKELGKTLAYQLSERTKGEFASWIVPRRSAVQVARKDHYDRDSRDTNAAFFVAAEDQGVTLGYRVGKPDGKEKDGWPWKILLLDLSENDKLRRSLRAAMKKNDMALDVYASDTSFEQVARITVQTRGFLWQHETAEQEMTRKMSWNELLEYLQTVAPAKRCELLICQQVAGDVAVEEGPSFANQISDVFESLIATYDASVKT
jgi:hypothetical protein